MNYVEPFLTLWWEEDDAAKHEPIEVWEARRAEWLLRMGYMLGGLALKENWELEVQ